MRLTEWLRLTDAVDVFDFVVETGAASGGRRQKVIVEGCPISLGAM